MPLRLFQKFPNITYDVDGDGSSKYVVDILRRIKIRVEVLLDGAIFYNYLTQEGDTPEIIADKYYGSAQYHWVVMLMNNIIHPTYDFVLNDSNFESYISGKYGSVDRAKGLSINLSTGEYMMPFIMVPQWHSYEQHKGSGFGANSQIDIGTMPAGHSTSIIIYNAKTSDPFSSIYVDDVVTIFIPEGWYDSSNLALYSKSSYATSAKVTGRSTYRPMDVNGDPVDSTHPNRNFVISLELNSNTYPEFTWDTDTETVSIQTGIHHYEMNYYNSTGTTLLADRVWIDQTRYANNSNPNSPSDLSKKIVSNYTYEDTINEDKRTIYLLKREYLHEFVDEFEQLVKG